MKRRQITAMAMAAMMIMANVSPSVVALADTGTVSSTDETSVPDHVGNLEASSNSNHVYNEGAMLAGTTTPDGYKLDSSGAWVK